MLRRKGLKEKVGGVEGGCRVRIEEVVDCGGWSEVGFVLVAVSVAMMEVIHSDVLWRAEKGRDAMELRWSLS